MPDFQSYILCMAPRSGSTLMCQLLADCGVAGAPGTFFHNASVVAWGEKQGVTVPEGATEAEKVGAALEAILPVGRGATEVLGMRLQMHSFNYFLSDLRVLHPGLPDDLARVERVFGPTLFIHLTREDKVAQAVSYVRASQTGLWHVAPDGREIERLSPPAEPRFDAEAIGAWRETFEAYDRRWRDWFAAEGIVPLEVGYDDLAGDPKGELRRVLEALGVDVTLADGVEIGAKKLADGMSEDWAARFRAGKTL